MILSKADCLHYLEQDRIALHKTYMHPRLFGDEVWRFQIALRKCEYAVNCSKPKIIQLYRKFILHHWSLRLGYTIPLNVFEEGLSIAHYGTIVINGMAHIGKNCRIQEDVNIGATGGNSLSPTLGNNIFIGTGAKIIGDIFLADNIAVGAGSIVTKSFYEPGITIAGIPAKKISNHSSRAFLDKRLFDK